MNLKQLFTMAKNKECKKVYFNDGQNEYLLTNVTQAKSGLKLVKVIAFSNYQVISDDIRAINKILKGLKMGEL